MKFTFTARTCALALSAATLLSAATALAIPADTTDPNVIMKAMEERPTGDKVINRVQMTITDDKGRQRQRVVQSRQLKFAGGTKQLTIIESPADVKNLAVLSIDYDDGAKDDDQWLYLPSQHKSTRISSSGKSGSFMGSDLTYADMTKKDPAQYTYKLLAVSEQIDGEDCWKVEATPKTDKERRETGYAKTITWVSKTKLLPLKSMMLVQAGRKTKVIRMQNIKQIDGIWMPHLLTAQVGRNNKRESMTTLRFLAVKLNDPSVQESDFTQRRLEKGL